MFTLDHFPLWYRRAAENPAGQFLYYLPRQDTRGTGQIHTLVHTHSLGSDIAPPQDFQRGHISAACRGACCCVYFCPARIWNVYLSPVRLDGWSVAVFLWLVFQSHHQQLQSNKVNSHPAFHHVLLTLNFTQSLQNFLHFRANMHSVVCMRSLWDTVCCV